MNALQLFIKKTAISVLENAIKLFWLFKINENKIMFISYTGAYSDSPKYTFLKLKEKAKYLNYVWAINKSCINEKQLSGCKLVEYGSLSYIKEICTSKIIVTNNHLNTFIPKRKEQIIVNTWHGGSPLKTVGMVNEPVPEYEKYFYKKQDKKYSIFLSSSEFMTKEVFRKSFGFSGRIFNCGLPRNAILFRSADNIYKKVSSFFNIPIDRNNGIVLYAPTFRGVSTNAGFISPNQQFDIKNCVAALEKKYNKKYYFLFRAHYFCDNLPANCIMATDYPDMQELLATADVLITDYSSCMGDMCLMNKPVFLYTPDLTDYIGERDFYWDIFTLPFPVAENEKELIQNILKFDINEYRNNVVKYLERLDSYEKPDSDIVFANYLLSLLKTDKMTDKQNGKPVC